MKNQKSRKGRFLNYRKRAADRNKSRAARYGRFDQQFRAQLDENMRRALDPDGDQQP